jgi:hypothetical protein
MNKLDLDTALALFTRATGSQSGQLFFDALTTDAENARAKATLVRLGVFGQDQAVPNAQNSRTLYVTPLADAWKQTEDQTLAQLKAKLVQALLGAE